MYFSHQLLLYLAVDMKNFEFVDFLMNNKVYISDNKQEIISPISFFKPCLPPIFGAIKEDNFELVCLFLMHGADPNALIQYDQFLSFINQYMPNNNSNQSVNSDTSFDSKKIRKSRNHSKHYVRPLDVALSMKKGKVVSTLIACGADVNVIDMENLKPNIKNQLEPYREDSSKRDLYNLPEKIRHLKKDIESYSTATLEQLDIMRAVENFRTAEISPLINKIRSHYALSVQVLTSIKAIAKIIFRKRNELLNSQFELLTEEDKIMKDILEKYMNSQAYLRQQDEDEVSLPKIDSDNSLILESDSYNDIQTNNRAELLYFNNRYSDLKELMFIFFQDLNEFHTNSLIVVDKLIGIMNNYSDTIHEFSGDILQRLGFDDDVISQIKEGNQKKNQIIQPTKSQLIEQKNTFTILHKKIRSNLFSLLR